MHVWWTKQEEFSDELDDLEEAAAEAAEREETAGKQEDARTGEAGGAGGDDADGGRGADADGEKEDPAAAGRASADSMSPQRRLASDKKKANTALSKEKKAR